MYKDVNVIDIEDGLIRKKTDPTEDVKNFFTDPFSCEGHKKRRRQCKICKWVFNSKFYLKF